MASKKHRPEEAVAKLRQVDVMVSQGQSVAEAIRAIGVTEVPARRAAGWRGLPLAARGLGRDRELAAPLQWHRPHASLGFKPPAPEVFVPAFAA